MNARQLAAVGLPDGVRKLAQTAIRDANAAGDWSKVDGRALMQRLSDDPDAFVDDERFGTLARAVIATRATTPPRDRTPAPFDVWGRELVDFQSLEQMQNACRLPSAVAGALMPDAHLGYGLPIGGVLALENAVCPYAVGVDIACRMKLSVLDIPASELLDDERPRDRFRNALMTGTKFGVGVDYGHRRQQHDVMDADWSVSRITREKKDKAWKQLGTSGSGNHFVEFGVLNLTEPQTLPSGTGETGTGETITLEAGSHVALLSHSGSRGTGAAVCSTYSGIARDRLPPEWAADNRMNRLGWLDMNSEAGQEYWAAMNLMGEYAAANHDVIHRRVSDIAGAAIVAGVENHHNFAWKETHRIGGVDREVYVHRKGATPAGEGVLGVIPGSMGTPAHVVRGLGSDASLGSASHGAGRLMSRTQAKSQFRFRHEADRLKGRGVDVLAAGSDEVPGVYKDIATVMAAQSDLVETIATFDPKVVRMCGDGSRAED